MKNINFKMVLVLLELTNTLRGKNLSDTIKNSPPSKDDISNIFNIGLACGLNMNTSEPIYNYYISQSDNTLKRDKLNNFSFVGSVVVSFTPYWTYLWKKTNETFRSPGPISFLGSYNLSDLNSTTGFNTKLNGGLGVGINIQNAFQIALFADFYQTKILRSSIANQLDKKIVVNNIELNSLDLNDNKYYYSDFRSSISLKFIYILSRGSKELKSGFGNDENSTIYTDTAKEKTIKGSGQK